MALSDYERRVLDEIEAELHLRPVHSWRLGRTIALLVFCSLVAAGLIVLAVLVLPPAFAAVVASLFGVAVGYIGGTTLRRRPHKP